MADEKNIFMHQPLPYVVTVSATLSEDTVPQEFTRKVTAYSIQEATMQVLYELGGTAPDLNHWRIVKIEPDLDGYFKLATQMIREMR